MGYEIRLNNDGVAWITCRTALTFEDALAAFHELTGPSGYVSPRRLWDLRDCEMKIDRADLRRLAVLARGRDSHPSRVALLANEDLVFGLMRQHGAFREGPNAEFRVFRCEDEALAWLGAFRSQAPAAAL